MTLRSSLRIRRLTLRNYRCFGEFTVDFERHLTVLAADNGSGKTTTLTGLAHALGPFVDGLAETRESPRFERRDIRETPDPAGFMHERRPVAFEAAAIIEDQEVQWSRHVQRSERTLRALQESSAPLAKAAHAIRKRLEAYIDGARTEPPVLPLVAFYGTGRLWSEQRIGAAKKTSDRWASSARTAGYLDCLSPSTSFRAFVDWFERMASENVHQTSTGRESPYRPELLLNAVRVPTDIVLEPTGWHTVDWDFVTKQMVVSHPELGRLPFASMSDGTQSMVSLVADLAHRCVRLNPHFGVNAALWTPGVLLIDEVDMHLHPRWQQRVLGALQKAFPAMQMVVTTHSPQVLSTVKAESIRSLRPLGEGRWTTEGPPLETEGLESAAVLGTVMHVDARPPLPINADLSRYRALVEDGHAEGEDARTLRTRLEAHFGPTHPYLSEVDRIGRFIALKRKSDAKKAAG